MLSVIVCSITPAKLNSLSAMFQRHLAGEPHEIICIRDARSMCEGYNRGLRQSRGDTLIFCHDDIEIHAPDFLAKLKSRLQRFDILGVAGATCVADGWWAGAGPPHLFGQVAHYHANSPHYEIHLLATPSRVVPNIQVMDGLFVAVRREVLERVQFDERTFTGFHCYDTDFTFSAHLAGFRLGVCCDFNVMHHSTGRNDPAWTEALLRFKAKHGPRLGRPVPMQFDIAVARVASLQDAISVMTPPYWADGD